MEIKHGSGTSEFGPGVDIELTGDEVATAIDAYLVAQWISLKGPRTVSINGSRCTNGLVHVDPTGFVISGGEKISGRGHEAE